jgi:D-alanine-D-alanine ligase
VPARLPKTVQKKIQEYSVKAFEVLKCEDYARVDLFYAGPGKIYVNEINTIPGFTNSSMYPMMWKERGISFTNLITRLIQLCLDRTEKNKRVAHDFNSSLKY